MKGYFKTRFTMIVVLAVILSVVPMTAMAAEDDCIHEHGAACGYIETVDCTHEHDETCGGLVCDNDGK